MTKWLRDPLTHFLLIGGGLFLLYNLVNDPQAMGDINRIEITPERLDQLSAGWQSQWRRPPTDEELDGLVKEYVRQEVLYREAVAMGLDQDDTIIKRRLAQKLEFLAEDIAGQVEPDAETLERWYEENADRFLEPPRVSFEHIYFSLDAQEDARQRAQDALVLLEREPSISRAELGDAFLLEQKYQDLDQRQVAALFGMDFAASIFQLPVNSWQAPVTSGYGEHAVRVISRAEGYIPPLGEVSDQVMNEFMREQRQAANDAVYEELRSRYEVVFMDGAEPETS